jgi:hypothetical protein
VAATAAKRVVIAFLNDSTRAASRFDRRRAAIAEDGEQSRIDVLRAKIKLERFH